MVGGLDDTGVTVAEVELVSLDPDNHPVPPCLTSLKELPVASYAMAGAVDEDGNPFVCGGRSYPSEASFDQCYKYDPQADSWDQHGTMPYKGAFLADIVVPRLGLVIVGADSSYDNPGDKVIATTDGVSFEELAPLPEPLSAGRHNSETRT